MKSGLISFVCGLALSLCAALSASAQVVITEIHYHPVEEPAFNADGTPVVYLTNDVHEFIEIQNVGAGTVDLTGWQLAGGITYTFPDNSTLASGAFRVIAKDPARLAAVYSLAVTNVLGPYERWLGNGGDTVRLHDAAGNTLDTVTYASTFPWAASADALGAQDAFTGLTSTDYQYKGRSLQRVSVTWPGSDPANWLASPLSGPTPGAGQAFTRTTPRPVVVAQSAVQAGDGAAIVRSNQAVAVSCAWSATNTLSSVTLEYFVDDPNSTTETRTSVPMTSLGSGAYAAPIPGQGDRSIVRYRFKANRGDGLEVVSPRLDDPQIAPVGPGGAREAWHGYFVTPLRNTANPAAYDVFVSTASLAAMGENMSQNPKRVTAATATGLPRDIPFVAPTAPQWNGTVPAVFACNGMLWDIRLRYHGSKYHRSTSDHSYKLEFPEHQRFNDQACWFETLLGSESIEAQRMNRLLGLPASRMRRVDWYYNNDPETNHIEQGEYAGEMLAEYHALEQQLNPGSTNEAAGELFLSVGNRDPSQNNLEGPYTRADEAPLAANAGWTQLQRYEWTFTPQNHRWKGAKPLRDLVESMWTARGDSPAAHNFGSNSLSLANARAWFTNNWDLDTTLTSMALLEWMGIWNDAAQNHIFWRRASGRWSWLGWDYEGVMSVTDTAGGLGGATNQTIYGGEYGAPTVFDGVNWWKDTFYKCFRNEYHQRLWELNNSFGDPVNLLAQGLPRAAAFAYSRRAYINVQLTALGAYYKPGRPVNLAPPDGATVLSATNLAISAYSHPQGIPHAATRWEIRAAAGSYEEPLLRWTATNNLTSLAVPFDQLTYGQTYYWRATQVDAHGHPSVVSAETSFNWGASSTTAGALVLNEILADNRNTVRNGGTCPDYIEIRNNSPTNINLAGYSLTDDPLTPAKFVFPAGTNIPAGGYVLVWADKETAAPGMHTGFGIDKAGETVVLMNGSVIVDSVSFGPQTPDISIGRIVNGTGGWQANIPSPRAANSLAAVGAVSNLRINEWMADPAYGEDWFEIYNASTNVVALGGLYLSDSPSSPMNTQIPPLSFIGPRGYTLFFADNDPSGKNHCKFKLAWAGESLVLTAANGVTTLDTIAFSAQSLDVSEGRLPDGSSNIVSFSSLTVSPGYFNWKPAPVYINELLANGASPFEDAIEIYNPTASPVAVGGWWLSDDLMNRQKFQIPAGTTVEAGGYAVFYEASLISGSTPFTLSALGGEVILSAVDDAGVVTGYGSLARVGASLENTSFGRMAGTGLNASSAGAEYWPMTAPRFGQDNPPNPAVFRTGMGAANSPPKIGPLIINEIMYHPYDYYGGIDNTQDEFIEVRNLSTNAVPLTGWRIQGDSEYLFPSGSNIAAGAYILLVSFNPTNTALLAAFRAVNGVPAAMPVFGPYSKKLGNGTHDIELACSATVAGSMTYILVDKVEYRDLDPWPMGPDGGGLSLQRISSAVIGDTAANWIGALPTPGVVNAVVATNVNITTESPLAGGLVGAFYSTSLAASGGTPPYSWTIASGSVPGLSLAPNGTFSGTPATAGTFTFDARATDSATAPVSATKSLAITVAATPLAITTGSNLPNGTVSIGYSQLLAASGGTAPYTWSIAGGALPSGLTLNGAGLLSGTPTLAGTFTFTAQVRDSGGLAAIRGFSLLVPVPALVITSLSPMVAGQQGSPYSQALTSAGGVTPYAWSLAGGSLPAGLSLSAVGDLTGTPTALGTFNFLVRLTDHAGTSVTKPLAVTVVPPALAVTTVQLPDGRVGAPYSVALTAAGGTGPYTWSRVWGVLPGGLGLSSAGVVSGIPTNTGTFSFIVQVADSLNANAQRIFTVASHNNAPILTIEHFAGGAFQLLVFGDSGPDYTIEGSTNLVDWVTVFTTNASVMPFAWGDTNTGDYHARFFRVRLGP